MTSSNIQFALLDISAGINRMRPLNKHRVTAANYIEIHFTKTSRFLKLDGDIECLALKIISLCFGIKWRRHVQSYIKCIKNWNWCENLSCLFLNSLAGRCVVIILTFLLSTLLEQLPKKLKLSTFLVKNLKALRAHSKSTKILTFSFSGRHLNSTSSRVSTEIT